MPRSPAHMIAREIELRSTMLRLCWREFDRRNSPAAAFLGRERARNRDLCVPTEFTHEEMAQMIGCARNSHRLLSDMKRKD